MRVEGDSIPVSEDLNSSIFHVNQTIVGASLLHYELPKIITS